MKTSVEEILSKRKDAVDDNGTLFKMVINEKGYDEENRESRFVMSAESEDRMKDIIRQDGLDMKDFLKNPMALAYHNHRAPIGMWKDVKTINGRPKRTEGVIKLHPEGTTAAVDEVANLLAVGGLKACSVGFRVREAEWIKDKDDKYTGGIEFIESDLLECSVVSIPAHPAALMKAAQGNSPLLKETMEYILDTMCEKTASGLFVRKEFADAYAEMQGDKTSVVINNKSGEHITVTVGAGGSGGGNGGGGLSDRTVGDGGYSGGGVSGHGGAGDDPSLGGQGWSPFPPIIDAQLEKTVTDKLDIKDLTPDEEKKVGSILDTVLGAIRGALGQGDLDKTMSAKYGSNSKQEDWSEYQNAIELIQDGDKVKFQGNLPEKTVISKEFLCDSELTFVSNDQIKITTDNLIADYKIAGEDELRFYLDLQKSYEPEPDAPELIPNSRAMAKAKTAKLMAELRSKGSIT